MTMHGKPLPEVYAGIIECHYANFRRFASAPPFDKFDFFVEGMFVEFLLQASSRRPVRAGHKGLMVEGARLFVDALLPFAKGFYVEFGGTTDWSAADLEALAVQIAEYHTNDRIIERCARRSMRAIRDRLYVSEVPQDTEHARYIVHSGETKIEGGVGVVFDASISNIDELPSETFIRTLDYIEHLSRLPGYSSLYVLKRDLTACLRVCHCIFGVAY